MKKRKKKVLLFATFIFLRYVCSKTLFHLIFQSFAKFGFSFVLLLVHFLFFSSLKTQSLLSYSLFFQGADIQSTFFPVYFFIIVPLPLLLLLWWYACSKSTLYNDIVFLCSQAKVKAEPSGRLALGRSCLSIKIEDEKLEEQGIFLLCSICSSSVVK